MRVLYWMYDMTRHNRIKNDNIKESVGVTSIVEKMIENRFKWFEHAKIRLIDYVVRRVNYMEISQTTIGRGRHRKIMREVIKKGIKINNLDIKV